MTHNQIKSLRQQGKLDEALFLAQEILDQQPNDIWAFRAWAWVKFDQLKMAGEQQLRFQAILHELMAYPQVQTEGILLEQIGWQLIKQLYRLQRMGEAFLPLATDLFQCFWQNFRLLQAPSHELRSALLSFSLKIANHWVHFLDFIQDYNLSNSAIKDFEKEISPNGTPYTPLVERAMIATAKKLLPLFDALDMAQQQAWLALFQQLETQNPTFVYVKYYRVKLLLLTSAGRSEAYTSFLPFARSKSNEFWVWELLSQCVETDSDKLACLCRAVLCKSPDEFLVGVKLQLAQQLEKMHYWAEAKSEAEHCRNIRQQKGWQLPQALQSLLNASWFESVASHHNPQRYHGWAAQAESLLYADLIQVEALVTELKTEQKWLKYINSEGTEGGFPYYRLLPKPQQGQCITLFVAPHDKSKVHWVQVKTPNQQPNWIHPFEGTVQLTKGGFGFVQDIYIPKVMLTSLGIATGNRLQGNYAYVLDPVKKKLGKKALHIAPVV